jgi:hypothetical protein
VSEFREGQEVRIKGAETIYTFEADTGRAGSERADILDANGVPFAVPPALLEAVPPNNRFGAGFAVMRVESSNTYRDGGAFLHIGGPDGGGRAIHISSNDVSRAIELLQAIQNGKKVA